MLVYGKLDYHDISYLNEGAFSTVYQIGDKVYHKKFGEGMIIGIKNGIGNIFFDKEKSSKSILLDHPALSKL